MEQTTTSNEQAAPSSTIIPSVFEQTRLILDAEEGVEPLEVNVPSTATPSDLASCVEQLMERLIVENDRSHPDDADARKMWENLHLEGGEALRATPEVLLRRVLRFCWEELHWLRITQHDRSRCSCFAASNLPNGTPTCVWDSGSEDESGYESEGAVSVDPEDADGDPESQIELDTVEEEPFKWNQETLWKESTAVVSRGQPLASPRAVDPSVTSREIWQCVTTALQRALAEIPANRPNKEQYCDE